MINQSLLPWIPRDSTSILKSHYPSSILSYKISDYSPLKMKLPQGLRRKSPEFKYKTKAHDILSQSPPSVSGKYMFKYSRLQNIHKPKKKHKNSFLKPLKQKHSLIRRSLDIERIKNTMKSPIINQIPSQIYDSNIEIPITLTLNNKNPSPHYYRNHDRVAIFSKFSNYNHYADISDSVSSVSEDSLHLDNKLM